MYCKTCYWSKAGFLFLKEIFLNYLNQNNNELAKCYAQFMGKYSENFINSLPLKSTNMVSNTSR